ncbi:MAG: iron ABC transporter permease [Desulfuromonadales bacterium]|nr:iron ABC transporter permease [Desulfuromonadales bacterium]
MRRLARFWPFLLLMLLGGALAFSLSVGPVPLGFSELLAILRGDTSDPTGLAVVYRIRLPRSLLAALVGAALSVAGAAFQAVLRNPLADPYILGVSGGAALGAVTAIWLGFAAALLLPVAAFVGALFALLLVYWVARAHRGSSHTLILCGVIVGSLASALLLFLLWLSPADQTRAAIFWLTGNLAFADYRLLQWIAPLVLVAFLILWSASRSLDLFTQGEETAADLGLAVGRARLLVLVAAGAMTAAVVAMAGLIGFVGLTVPHIVRLLLGPAHHRLLPASALAGATFLVLADALSRQLYAPAEIPVGVVTALLGAPFFLYLLRAQRTLP